MSSLDSGNESRQSNSQSDDNEYDDDSISFQFESQKITLHYLQFFKYSTFIRTNYLVSDIANLFPKELQNLQQRSNISTDNIYLFFHLLDDNFNINDDFTLTYKQYIDLFKISEFLQIKKLSKRLKNYFQTNQSKIDFIIQIIQYETSIQKNSEKNEFQITQIMEQILSSKINECLQNETFSELDVSFIYRIIDQSNKNQLSSDFLFSFIMKSIEKFHVLFALQERGMKTRNSSDFCLAT